jgi:hypothetical protein
LKFIDKGKLGTDEAQEKLDKAKKKKSDDDDDDDDFL